MRLFLVTITLGRGMPFILETEIERVSGPFVDRQEDIAFLGLYSSVIKSRMIVLNDKYQMTLKTWKQTKTGERKGQGKGLFSP